jgi:hypothetical protein
LPSRSFWPQWLNQVDTIVRTSSTFSRPSLRYFPSLSLPPFSADLSRSPLISQPLPRDQGLIPPLPPSRPLGCPRNLVRSALIVHPCGSLSLTRNSNQCRSSILRSPSRCRSPPHVSSRVQCLKMSLSSIGSLRWNMSCASSGQIASSSHLSHVCQKRCRPAAPLLGLQKI